LLPAFYGPWDAKMAGIEVERCVSIGQNWQILKIALNGPGAKRGGGVTKAQRDEIT
jgi:hypothetical protein